MNDSSQLVLADGSKRMPASATLSKISANASAMFIDREASAHKNKPNRHKLQFEKGDEDSDIYEGEQISFNESDFHNDMTEEYVEVEEIEK